MTKDSLCCTPYLRNHTSYKSKWWYVQVIFSYFQNIDFSVVSGVKGQKMAQNDKQFCLLSSISQEPSIIWLSFMVHKCKMIISPGIFFIFSKFWFFGLLGGSKGRKWSKITKKCPSCIFSQEPYIICLKGQYLQICLHFFQILIFGVNSGVKGQKMTQSDKKWCLLHSISQGAYIIWSWLLVHMCKMMTSQDASFIVSKFWFSGLLGG